MKLLGLFLICALTLINAAPSKKTYKIGSHLSRPFLFIKPGIEEDFEGFVVDFAHLLDEYLKIDHKIVLSSDGTYGTFAGHGLKKWKGLIGDIVDGTIDFAIADLAVTDQRKEVVDFSTPFMNSGVGIIYASTTRQALPFNNLDELVNQSEVKYGAIIGGSTVAYIYEMSKTNEKFKKMVDFWEAHPEYLMSSNYEGVEKVVNEEGKFAFLTEVHAFGVLHEKYPSIMKVGDIIVPREFAVAFPKGSPMLPKVNEAIEHLKESGQFNELLSKWKMLD